MCRQRAGGEWDSHPSSLAGCLGTRPWVALAFDPALRFMHFLGSVLVITRTGPSGATSTGSGSCLPLGDRHRRTGASGQIRSVAAPHQSCPARLPTAPEQEARFVASAAFPSVDIALVADKRHAPGRGSGRRAPPAAPAQRAHLHLQREGGQPLAALSSLQLRSGLHGNLATRQD